MQRRSGQLIHLLYLVAYIFLTYKRPLNILHTKKRKFLSINNSIKHLFNIFQFHMIFLSFCKYAAPKYIEKLQGDVNENGQKILDSRARDAW